MNMMKIFKSLEIPEPEQEYKFDNKRKFRIDFAWKDIKLAIEIEGGIWMSKFGKKSRHFYGVGAINDMIKYNLLTEKGWVLLRYQPDKIDYDQIKRVYLMRKYELDLFNNLDPI